MARTPRKAGKKQVQPEIGPEKAFGQALREIRKEAGISQEKLAEDGDFDRTFISLIERGINSPSIRTLVKLARVLQVPPSVIVVRMEEMLAGAKGVTFLRQQP